MVPRHHRLEVTERVDAQGAIVEALREEDVEDAIDFIKRHDIEAVAVSLLFACGALAQSGKREGAASTPTAAPDWQLSAAEIRERGAQYLTACVNDWDKARDERLFHFQLHIRANRTRRNGYRDLIALRTEIRRLAFHKGGVGPVVALHIWERDCDGVESHHATLIPADDWRRFVQIERELHENAEGPFRISLMTEKEYQDFEPSTRDTYAEAAGY